MSTRRRPFRPRARVAAALAAALLLAGCESLLPGRGPPPQLYQLSPKSTFSDRLPKVDWQLTVEVPFASAALDTTRIPIMTAPTQFNYYARAAWTDRAPLMLQTLLVESFQNSRRIVGVGRDTIGLRSDFMLKTELREFQAEAFDPSGGRVHVAMDAKLVRMPERVIVASREFKHTVPADIDDLSSVVSAFDRALGRVLRQLVEWALISGEQHRPAVSVGPVTGSVSPPAPEAHAAPASPPAWRRPAAPTPPRPAPAGAPPPR